MTRARDLAAFVSNADGDIKFDTDTLFIDSSANSVGIQTATPAFPLDVSTNSATTNDAVTMLRISANSSGTAANNFGAAINFSGEDASGSLRDLSTINSIYTDATNRSSAMTFKTRKNLGSLTEHMRIDADGNVGIGNTSPDTPLYVDCGAPSSADKTIATFQSQTSRQIGFVWDDSASTMGIASLTNHPIAFHINGNSSETMRVTSDGLTFNGDTAAANALNDFEQGTWTPALASSIPITVNTGGQPAANSYIKIGKLVYVSFDVTIGSNSSSSHVMITSASLPYASQNYAAGVIGWTDYPTKPLAMLVSGSGLGLYNDGNTGTIGSTMSVKRIIGFAHYITA